mmetsp:Transcript_12299/g.29574  ORF Transcript_12299/g.29574 Transcript_12299/m.29574 type:complete len:428 (-) Transcript_12299:128-1411(-)
MNRLSRRMFVLSGLALTVLKVPYHYRNPVRIAPYVTGQDSSHRQQQQADVIIGPADKAFHRLELFVSAFPGDPSSDLINGFAEMQSSLIRSLEFFWPSFSMTVVLDDTVYDTVEGQQNMMDKVHSFFRHPNQVSVRYNPRSNNTLFGRGYCIQQLIMFWADNFTDAEYIGFVDDDTVFTGAVQSSDLFDDEGRPRALVRPAKLSHKGWVGTTREILKHEPLANGMNYFPVIVHRSLLPDLRAHILSLHPQYSCFDDFYREVLIPNDVDGAPSSPFSQFFIMMDYAYYHHHDAYNWHVELQKCHEPDSPYPPEECVPFPFAAVHAGWYMPPPAKMPHDRAEFVTQQLKQGYCYSLPLYRNWTQEERSRCEGIQTLDVYNWNGEWNFEVPTPWRTDPIPAKLMNEAHMTKRYNRIDRDWDEEELYRLFG